MEQKMNSGKLLIVIDMQNDFIDGALGTAEAVAIVGNVKAKMDAYRAAGDDIIFTRDTHQPDYLETAEGRALPVVHCVEGSWGWQVREELEDKTLPHIDKPNFGWMGWKDLGLEKYESIELVGLCTDICVVSNALILKAAYPEMPLSVDASCCAAVTPATHTAALATMKMCQVNVINECA